LIRSVLVALLLVPATAAAGGFEVAQQSAAAAGTGHAGTGRSGDPSAAWFNPAALADGEGLRATMGIAVAGISLRSAALPGAPDAPWEATTEGPPATPPHAYFSFSKADWAAGVSVNLAFAGGVQWAEDWRQRFEIIRSQPRFVRIAPFFAYRLGPVRIAGGPHIDMGQVSILKATNHIEEEGSAELRLSGVGIGADVAVFIRFGDHAQLGVSYKSRTKLELSGEADFDVPKAFQSRYPDGAVASEWTLPDRIAVGVGLQPKGADRLRIYVDMSLTLWSVNDELLFDFEDDRTTDIVQDNRWRDSVALRGGAEVRVHDAVTLRAGAYVDGLFGAPPPDETLSPSSPDSTRLGLTIGGRIHLPKVVSIDLFYEHLRLLPRESTSPDAPQASYGGFANVGGISVTFHVPEQ
jgi:long-chain fatty acid transport protein